MTVPVLETDRIFLRPVTLRDAPAMQRHFANWNVVKWIGGIPWPYPEHGAQAYIARRLKDAESREVYFWGIFLKEASDELIGAIEYRFFDDEEENRGFWLSEAHWGKGVMTDAVALSQDFIFLELGKAQILIRSLSTNAASKAVKEKTGARLIGKSMGRYHNGQQEEDVWQVTKESWRATKTPEL